MREKGIAQCVEYRLPFILVQLFFPVYLVFCFRLVVLLRAVVLEVLDGVLSGGAAAAQFRASA